MGFTMLFIVYALLNSVVFQLSNRENDFGITMRAFFKCIPGLFKPDGLNRLQLQQRKKGVSNCMRANGLPPLQFVFKILLNTGSLPLALFLLSIEPSVAAFTAIKLALIVCAYLTDAGMMAGISKYRQGAYPIDRHDQNYFSISNSAGDDVDEQHKACCCRPNSAWQQ